MTAKTRHVVSDNDSVTYCEFVYLTPNLHNLTCNFMPEDDWIIQWLKTKLMNV